MPEPTPAVPPNAVHDPADDEATAPAAPAADGLESLGLTVHDTPEPARDAQDAARGARGRRTMLLILALCALPVLASYFMYYVVRPQGRTTNYATLVEPQRPLPGIELLPATTPDGRAVPLTTLKGQWLLVVVAPGRCGASCEKLLFMQRQLREMMGAERDRIDKVWLVDSPEPVAPALASALAARPPVAIFRVGRDALARWLEPERGHALEDHLYIVDPLGNWMMRAPADADPAKLRRDLDKLLRASAWWDRPRDAR